MEFIERTSRGLRKARRLVGERLPERLTHRQQLIALKAELRTTRDELQQSRARARKLKGLLTATKADSKQRTQDARAIRASVRDPDPTIMLDERAQAVVDAVLAERLSYLKRPNLTMLARLAAGLSVHGTEGLIVECGTALGGSAIVMAAAKEPTRPMKVYDVFGMIPPPSDMDGADIHQRYDAITSGSSVGVGGDVYYGYRDNLYDEVEASFARLGVPTAENNVQLIKGLFQDTLELDEPVALAHLDGDWYESTMICLERIAPLLVVGGRIVLDDYFAWSGCRRATDEYFAGRPEFVLEHRAKVHAVRVR